MYWNIGISLTSVILNKIVISVFTILFPNNYGIGPLFYFATYFIMAALFCFINIKVSKRKEISVVKLFSYVLTGFLLFQILMFVNWTFSNKLTLKLDSESIEIGIAMSVVSFMLSVLITFLVYIAKVIRRKRNAANEQYLPSTKTDRILSYLRIFISFIMYFVFLRIYFQLGTEKITMTQYIVNLIMFIFISVIIVSEYFWQFIEKLLKRLKSVL